MPGDHPPGWRSCSLKDIAAIQMGETIIAKDLTGDGIPVFSAGRGHEPWGFTSSARKAFRRGTIVVGARGSLGFPRLPNFDVFVSTQTTIAVTPSDAMEPAFFWAALTALDYEKLGAHQAVPMLTIVALESATVPVPPLPEQKKIAAILSSVDEAIQATRAVIGQTRQVKEGLLQNLLTRGLPGHTRFKQTEIGEIPESWDVRPVGEVCSRVGVGIASSATHAYRENGVPLVRNQNIKYGYLDLSDLLYVDEGYDRANQTKRIHTGDVLTIRTGYAGASAVVPPMLNNAQSFTTLVSSPKSNLIRSEFLAAWINGPVGRRLVLAGEAGGAQHNLNAGELKRLPVPVPPLAEQDGIIRILESLSATEASEQEVLGRLSNAKSGLLHDLLTGRVRVSP
jgi:type I restriction enzyme S subunit